MAVAAGGVLEQHLPDRVGHVDHSPGVAVYGHHPVTTVPGTRLAALLGDETDVPSYHHQSVLTHPGFEPRRGRRTAPSRRWRTPTARFRLGVQWHPEVGDDPRLFDALVEAARERAASRHGSMTAGDHRRVDIEPGLCDQMADQGFSRWTSPATVST